MTDEDPFDDIDPDDYRDRQGDPFADLDADGPASDETPAETGDSATRDDATEPGPSEQDTERDPFEYREAGDRQAQSGQASGESQDTETTAESRSVDVVTDPFSDVDVSRGDPFESANTPFERESIDGVDPDEVWDRFTAKAESARVDDTADRSDDVVTVSKHRFCEGCEYFSAPPDVECGHEGTTIVEFVGTEEVRLANCPIVRERRELGEVHE